MRSKHARKQTLMHSLAQRPDRKPWGALDDDRARIKKKPPDTLKASGGFIKRREGDSNPRGDCSPTRIPIVRLQPLSHLSCCLWPGQVPSLGCDTRREKRSPVSACTLPPHQTDRLRRFPHCPRACMATTITIRDESSEVGHEDRVFTIEMPASKTSAGLSSGCAIPVCDRYGDDHGLNAQTHRR